MGPKLTDIYNLRFGDCNIDVDGIKEVEIIDEFAPSTIEEDAIKYLNNISLNEITFELNEPSFSYDLLEQITTFRPDFYTIEYTKYVQARKHKKKRISKKWLKRYGYKPVQVRTEGWKMRTYEDGSFEFVKSMGDE